VCGGCGVLNREIMAGHPLILTSAVRDEGTSYHYLPPAREVKPHPKAVAALEKTLAAEGVEFRLGKSWTTDAIYRETPGRRKLRVEEGCDVVEMEAAAFFAVAQFREIVLGQLVYGGDLVVPDGWDGRAWHKRTDDRRLMFDLAVKAVLQL
jgi:uridine phosphorylase